MGRHEVLHERSWNRPRLAISRRLTLHFAAKSQSGSEVMKCVQFKSTGEPRQVLKCVERDAPSPKHGEVLVRMLASPVNPSDLMFVRGVYGVEPHLPQSPGFEGVGIVEASGGGLRGKLFRSKRVAVLNRAGGNWSEYAVVPAAQVIPLSSRLSMEQAAHVFRKPGDRMDRDAGSAESAKRRMAAADGRRVVTGNDGRASGTCPGIQNAEHCP